MFRFPGRLKDTYFGWSPQAHSVCGPEVIKLSYYLICPKYGPALHLKEKLLKTCVETNSMFINILLLRNMVASYPSNLVEEVLWKSLALHWTVICFSWVVLYFLLGQGHSPTASANVVFETISHFLKDLRSLKY